MNLSKTFDFFSFNIIISLEKLEFYGVSEYSCKLIHSYLTNRKQYISTKCLNSSVANVTMVVFELNLVFLYWQHTWYDFSSKLQLLEIKR